MADITRRLGRRHLRGAPTAHVRHHRSGRLVHDGPGLSFWYPSLTAALSEVPVDDRELAMTFHARTSDFQDVAVQATVTYRIVDPAIAAARLDFSIDPDTGAWRGAPRTAGFAADRDGPAARAGRAGPYVAGVSPGRRRRGGTGADRGRTRRRAPAARDGDRGGGRTVVALRPEPEVERALRTPPASRSSRRRTRRRTSAGPSPSSGSGRSPRTSSPARSNSPGARSSWSTSAAPTRAARRRSTRRPTRCGPGRRRPAPYASRRRRAPGGTARQGRGHGRARGRRGAGHGAGRLAAGPRGGGRRHAARPDGHPARREPAPHRQRHGVAGRPDGAARQAGPGTSGEPAR